MNALRSLIVGLVVIGSITTSAAAQTGFVRASWESCDPIQFNQDFTGPGQIANLVVSTIGTVYSHRGYWIQFLVRPDPPDAWRFDGGGCNQGQLALVTTGLSPSCPAFQGSNPYTLLLGGYIYGPPGVVTVDVINEYELVGTPDPTIRYTVCEIRFDHTFSQVGPSDPAVACGNAEQPVCLVLSRADLRREDSSFVPWEVESGFVYWQSPDNELNCPMSTQNTSGTWGRVKSLYR